jgi:hypothetical protein
VSRLIFLEKLMDKKKVILLKEKIFTNINKPKMPQLSLDQMRRILKSHGVGNYSKKSREVLVKMMQDNNITAPKEETEIVAEPPTKKTKTEIVVKNTVTNNVSLGDGTGKVITLRILNDEALTYIKGKIGDFKLKWEHDHENPIPCPDWEGLPEWKLCNQKWYIVKLTVQGEKERKFIEGWDFTNPQKITDKTRSIWFPHPPDLYKKGSYWVTTEKVVPKYPIFVISKGRWEKRLTSKWLDKMHVAHKLVIEEQERDKYIEHGCDPEILLLLPTELCNLGKGSITVRNFIWDYSNKMGCKRHWCLDDNIDGFYRFHNNTRLPVYSGVVFRVIEDYVDRFNNIHLSGLNYYHCCPNISKRRLLCQQNTRIYSCILIQNDCPHRWRGVYNEDTDLSLRVLKDGTPTMLFNLFLCDKKETMTCKGGNTDSIYQQDGLEKKVDSLVQQHPDCVKKTYKKYNRPHHQVDYTSFFNNKPISNGSMFAKGTNEYGLKLVVPQ